MNTGYGDGRLSGGGVQGMGGRIFVIAAAIILAFFTFALRLFQLQIVEGAELRSRSEQNFVRTIRLDAPRGEIVDREGRVLAATRPAYRVQIIPNELHGGDRTFLALGQILGEAPSEIARRVGQPSGRKRFQPIVLRGDLGYERFAQVESHRYALPGVVTNIGPRRHYVEVDLAAHLLGTIGEGTPDETRLLIQAAVRYFLIEEDGDGDLNSVLGFDDDAEVMNAVLVHLGHGGWLVETP